MINKNLSKHFIIRYTFKSSLIFFRYMYWIVLAFCLRSKSFFFPQSDKFVEYWILDSSDSVRLAEGFSSIINIRAFHLGCRPFCLEKKGHLPIRQFSYLYFLLDIICSSWPIRLVLPHLSPSLIDPQMASCLKAFCLCLIDFYEDGLTCLTDAINLRPDMYPIHSNIKYGWKLESFKYATDPINQIPLAVRPKIHCSSTSNVNDPTVHILSSTYLSSCIHANDFFLFPNKIYYLHPNSSKNRAAYLESRDLQSLGPSEDLLSHLYCRVRSEDLIICGFTSTTIHLIELIQQRAMPEVKIGFVLDPAWKLDKLRSAQYQTLLLQLNRFAFVSIEEL